MLHNDWVGIILYIGFIVALGLPAILLTVRFQKPFAALRKVYPFATVLFIFPPGMFFDAWYVVVLALIIFLGAAYILWTGQRTAQKHLANRPPKANATQPDFTTVAKRAPKLSFSAKSLGFTRLLTRLLIVPPRMPVGIQVQDIFISRQDHSQLRIRLYQPRGAAPKAPALLWMHGGGYVVGTPKQDDAYLVPFIQEIGLVVASVDYRLAPEHPFPDPLEDCYAALRWLAAQSETLGLDPERIAIGGSSAGAGLAAALAHLAHDRDEIRPAFQLLVYPMLDDRTAACKEIDPQAHFVWNNANNRFGWETYLHQPCGAEQVPAGSVPARRVDLTGLAPAWIGVGTADLFYGEGTAYAGRLNQAGVPCELVTIPGAFHAFDIFAPGMQAVKDFRRSQVQALKNALTG